MKLNNDQLPITNNQIITNHQSPINNHFWDDISRLLKVVLFGYCNLVIGYFSGVC